VTFDACGGSSVDSISIPLGQPVGELPVATRDGYEFLGWFTAADGGVAVTPETIVTSDMTFYARWTIKSYTVVFDANGGSGSVTRTYTHGSVLGELPVATREKEENEEDVWIVGGEWIFMGWFMRSEMQGLVTESTVVTGPMTLYAGWMTTPGEAITKPEEPI
jgi:uncharacterized repeat protein (TIGR02543 family)